jgi:hypothetical protein
MLEFLQLFLSQAVIQRTIVDFPAIFKTGLAENIAVCVHTNRVPNKKGRIEAFFVCSGSELFKYSYLKFKNSKTYSGSCPFQGLSNDTTLMLIQSGRTVPDKRKPKMCKKHPRGRFISDRRSGSVPGNRSAKLIAGGAARRVLATACWMAAGR